MSGCSVEAAAPTLRPPRSAMTTGDDEAEIHHDLETGPPSNAPADEGGSTIDEEFSDPFDIGNTKNASHDLLKRWRVRRRMGFSCISMQSTVPL